MKRISLFVAMVAVMFACNSTKEAAPEEQAVSTKASYRKETPVKNAEFDLNLTVTEVRDSRCPMDVVCVTMGQAEIDFIVSDGSESRDVTVFLSPSNKESGKSKFDIGGKNYMLNVTEVLPYPQSTVKTDINDYKVSVSITRN